MSEVKTGPRIQDLNKFTLFADIPGVENQRARLTWSIRGGQPRISVFLFNPATSRNEVLSAPLSPEIFLFLCDKIEEVASAAPGTKYKIECLLSVRDAAGKPTQEKRTLSELWFGIDADGLVWMSIIDGEKPRIKFNFSLWDYHKLYKPDGSVFTQSECSIGIAKATIRALRDIYTRNMGEFVEYTPAGNKNTAAATTAVKNDTSMLEDLSF